MLVDKLEIFCMSFVSMYNQIMASTERRGIEAKIPPIKELFFDASDTTTINVAERTTLTMYCHIISPNKN